MTLPIARSVQQSGSTSCISPKTKKLKIECKAIAPLFLPNFHLTFPRTPVTQSEHLRLDPERLWNAHTFYGLGPPGLKVGFQAIQFAAQGVMAGGYDLVVACGEENVNQESTPAN